MNKWITTVALCGTGMLAGQVVFAQEINALVWCDHADPALIEPFTAATGITVNLKEYEGTAAGLAILEQSQPGDWDVLVIDAVDVGRAVDLGLLAALPADQLPTASFFPELVMADNNTRDGVTYAVTEKFGHNTIAYNRVAVDPADMEDMGTLLSGKYDGRIAIYDYYLPVLGMMGLNAGVATADLDAAAVEGLREPLMQLRAASKLVGDVVSSQTALATGEVDILVGGGEWLTAVLAADNPDLDWTIPAQGVIAGYSGGFNAASGCAEVCPIHHELRGAGTSGHVVLLLGDARQCRCGRRADGGTENHPALG